MQPSLATLVSGKALKSCPDTCPCRGCEIVLVKIRCRSKWYRTHPSQSGEGWGNRKSWKNRRQISSFSISPTRALWYVLPQCSGMLFTSLRKTYENTRNMEGKHGFPSSSNGNALTRCPDTQLTTMCTPIRQLCRTISASRRSRAAYPTRIIC
jgi:hypothetical protein